MGDTFIRNRADHRFSIIICVLLSILLWPWEQVHAAVQTKSLSAPAVYTGSKQLLDEPVLLDQEWDFYWNRWIEPGEDLPAADFRTRAVHGWTGKIHPANGLPIAEQGIASYRIELHQLAPTESGYELRFPFISSAARVLVYAKNAPDQVYEALSGKPGRTIETTVPQIRDIVLTFHPKSLTEEWVVIVQVANFHHPRGGILSFPFLALGPELSKQLAKDMLGFFLSMGVTLVIGFYSLMLFMRRKTDYASLTLACVCFSATARTFANSNLINLYSDLSGPASYHFKYFLEYSTLCLVPMSYSAFVHYSFRTASWPWALKVLTFISGIGFVCCLIFPPLDYARYLGLYQFSIALQTTFAFAVIVRAYWRKVESSRLALCSAFVIIFGIVYDILVARNLLPQPYILQYSIDVFVFLQSQIVASRFAKAFRTAENLTAELEMEVSAQTRQIRSLMENVPQGIFMIGSDRCIEPDYSKHLETILGRKNLANQSVAEMLFEGRCISSETKSLIDTILLTSFGEPMIAWEMNAFQLPSELTYITTSGAEQILEFEWHPLENESHRLEKVLVTIRDVTRLRALLAENAKKDEQMLKLVELLTSAPQNLPLFFKNANFHVERAKSCMSKVLDSDSIRKNVLAELHSVKGLARSQGLRNLSSLVHESEQRIKEQLTSESEIRQEVESIQGSIKAYEAIFVEKFQGFSLSVLHDSTCYQHDHGFSELSKESERLAQELGKERPHVAVLGAENLDVSPETRMLLSSALLHVVRNSLDHGIETPEERVKCNKAPQGNIHLSFEQTNSAYILSYEDDGRGLYRSELEKQARRKGIWNQARSLNLAEAANLLFHSGFSTKEVVSEISGRGVGLNAVKAIFQELGGDVDFDFQGIDIETAEHAPFRLLARFAKR